MSCMARLVEHAPAKVNLTLAVLGRRADGYHLLDSLVVFADVGDSLTLTPGGPLTLNVRGVTAKQAGPVESNLVFKAAKALATEIPNLKLGRFTLDKRLPVAAGLGGGSSDAAAALRLLARANRLKRNDKRLLKVAGSVGADVPVCVDPRPRRMRGVGEKLSAPLAIPKLAAGRVSPGGAVRTRDVVALFCREPRSAYRAAQARAPPPGRGRLSRLTPGERNERQPAGVR